MLYSIRLFLIVAVCIVFITACVTTPTDFEEPSVSVTSFKPKISTNISPQFEIVLHVTNPNREPLQLEGMSYTIQLEGIKDRKSTRLNSSHQIISYAVFCLKKKKNKTYRIKV